MTFFLSVFLRSLQMTAQEKHAATLNVVQLAPFYRIVREFCSSCYKLLRDTPESETFDCRMGKLCGCGIRYCSLNCLVSDRDKHGCAEIQTVLCELARIAFDTAHAGATFGRISTTIHPAYLILMAELTHPCRTADECIETVAKECTRKGQHATAKLLKDSMRQPHIFRSTDRTETPSKSVAIRLVSAHSTIIKFAHVVLEEHFGDTVAFNLYARSRAWSYFDRFDEAIADVQSAHQLYRELLGEYSPEVANCFKVLALYLYISETRQAEMHPWICAAEYLYRRFGLLDVANECRELRKKYSHETYIYDD
jgi:hypothetical protein